MCLAVPGRIEKIFEQEGMKMAKVNFSGIGKSICLEYIEDAQEGDYVLVHVGFAISKIDEQEARRNLEILKMNNELAELNLENL